MLDQIFPLAGAWRSLAILVLASAIVMGSPGPATISVTALGAAFGVAGSLKYLAGVVVGTIAVLLAVATGVVAALTGVPRVAPLLIAASAAYILYLAWRIATAPPLGDGNGAPAPSFAGGFLLAVANPKAYVAIAAVFASAAPIVEADGLDALLKTIVLSLMIVVIHVAWLLVGSSFARFLRDPKTSRMVNVLFAAILVATSALAFVG